MNDRRITGAEIAEAGDAIADEIAVRQPVPEPVDDLHGRIADALLLHAHLASG